MHSLQLICSTTSNYINTCADCPNKYHEQAGTCVSACGTGWFAYGDVQCTQDCSQYGQVKCPSAQIINIPACVSACGDPCDALSYIFNGECI